MQMLFTGKQYFEREEEPETLPEPCAEELPEEENGSRHMPAWLSRTFGVVRENKKHFIVAASVLVIGAAVYLNWALYDTASKEKPVPPADNGTKTEEKENTEPAKKTEEDLSDDYFAVSLINRQRARDEAIEVLQNVADGAENLSEVREDALAGIAQIAEDIEHEAAIESLVKGKGFSDCVAVISGGNANIIVRSQALLPNELAQIQEIVYETSGILPANVKIIEK